MRHKIRLPLIEPLGKLVTRQPNKIRQKDLNGVILCHQKKNAMNAVNFEVD